MKNLLVKLLSASIFAFVIFASGNVYARHVVYYYGGYYPYYGNYSPYYARTYSRCWIVRGHYNRHGYWIPTHRKCR